MAATLPAFAASNLTLAWDAPTPALDVAGYIVHYGTNSGQYASATNVGNATTATISGLQDGVIYYFAVTDYNSAPNLWVRLVRTGSTLNGYKSTDGVNWTLVNSRNITMATNTYVGLAVASGSSSTLNVSTFGNVTVVP